MLFDKTKNFHRLWLHIVQSIDKLERKHKVTISAQNYFNKKWLDWRIKNEILYNGKEYSGYKEKKICIQLNYW
jgi:hypothetical protein